MSTMTLFHGPLSPFVRKVMVVLHETAQLDRVALQPVNISPVSGDEQLNQGNPIGKIPALRLEDGTVLHDSRVICEYLDCQHVGTPLIPREGSARWRRMTLASQADAIMDAAVSTRYETFLRPQDKRWDGWVAAQSEKIRRSLANLEREHLAELASGFDIAAIGVACALGYLDFRFAHIDWRARHDNLARLAEKLFARPSFAETLPG